LVFVVTRQKETDKSKSDITQNPVIEEYTVSINSAPNSVRAFGFDVLFDNRVLKFKKFIRKGFTVNGFKFFDMNIIAPGRLRMGGVSLEKPPVEKGASGDIAVLYFEIIAEGSKSFKITSLKDHMESWDKRIGKDRKEKDSPLTIKKQ
jgi:hypothetical protein